MAHKGERTNKRCFSFITIEMRTKQRISDFSVIKIWQTSISLFIYHILYILLILVMPDRCAMDFSPFSPASFQDSWILEFGLHGNHRCCAQQCCRRSGASRCHGSRIFKVPRCTKSTISTVYISLAWINLNQLESTWWFWDIPRTKMLSGIVAVDSDLQSLTTDGLHTLGRTWRWKFKPWMNRLAGWEVLEVKE